jgi:hypothetical protein
MGVLARTTRDDLTHDTTLGRGESAMRQRRWRCCSACRAGNLRPDTTDEGALTTAAEEEGRRDVRGGPGLVRVRALG